MHIVIPVLLVLGLLFGPQWWARYVLRHHSKIREDIPGTGAQFARHLLGRLKMEHVVVEATDRGDHYDPQAAAVRLSEDNFHGRSLTAMVVAAHEIGHAIQDHQGYAPLQWRSRLVVLAHQAERMGSGVMLVMPLVAALTRSPGAGAAMALLGVMIMAAATVVHLVTLPVEWDASFGRAMPILQAGRYIEGKDEIAARRILRACALTYAAASLASLLNLWRWLRVWRR